AFLLYSPWSFAFRYFLIDPVLMGSIVAFIVSQSPGLKRAFMLRGERRNALEKAARATFVEKGVHHTQGRRGLLVYFSLLEQEVMLVPDTGIEQNIPAGTFQPAVEMMKKSLAQGADAAVVAPQLTTLKTVLQQALPRDVNDINELPDEICE